ncbi:uncharacterized protein LOC110707591 [Chenopodium quinoa]|uniref:uncharacterized protein LOC110707591 n=1 Tax=Chenopodium quinoa TaxID=63459 RepID=UPI000B7784DE|nr:uncharacterized protein LOC110707591 [Chenopodium quinoa]
MVTFPPSEDLPECIFGDVRPKPDAAEQSLAKKCVTPNGKEASIPPQIVVPRPPKKRIARLSFGAPTTSVTGHGKVIRIISGELETVFKCRKNDFVCEDVVYEWYALQQRNGFRWLGCKFFAGTVQGNSFKVTTDQGSTCKEYSTKRLKALKAGISLRRLNHDIVDIARVANYSKTNAQGVALICDKEVPAEPLQLPARIYCSKCYAKKFAYEPLMKYIYHNLPDLLPDDTHPKHLQMYFYDAEHEVKNRSSTFPEVEQEMVQLLMQVMDRNPYAQFFRSLREIPVVESTEIHLNRNPVLGQRVYNAPTANEVDVIWSEETSSSEYSSPHIIACGKRNTTTPHRIMHYYGCHDPLQYPLLYPHGDCEWHEGLEKINTIDSNVPLQQEVCPLESIESVEDLLAEEEANIVYNYVMHLMAKGEVDMYVKLENTRLDFFRRNQVAIRADLYQGLVDCGPRDLRSRYLNAITLVQRFGKPNLLITIMSNPNWPKIKKELAPGELAQNRPDLVARIFHAKLIALKKQIMEEKIFGEVAALIYVVEFQSIKDPAAFDKFVAAEIPSTKNPHLREVVLSHMIHGPCGKENPECSCMKHRGRLGVCKYGYPKPYVTKTTSHEDGYPMYRRHDTGETLMIRKKPMDNRWVIPYNPYLLALFDCHMNVEVYSTICAVKYLYKYVYKGHDRISFNVSSAENPKPRDEIEQFQSRRWVSPCEAAWRLFSFGLFEMHPPVLPLQIHLPNLQTVQFRIDESLDSVVNDTKRHKTALTEFFAMNAANPDGPQYLYSEFSKNFVWTAATKAWTRRGNKKIAIGRMAFVAPSEGERYYLCLFLANVWGPKSFEDLRTVDGNIYATFHEAAIKLGLIAEDDAVDKCMSEASETHMPKALRRLFATVLIFCNPCNPLALWNRFYSNISEVFVSNPSNQAGKVQYLTVRFVEQYLEEMGKSLLEFGLDGLMCETDDAIRRTQDIVDALDAPVPDIYIKKRA